MPPTPETEKGLTRRQVIGGGLALGGLWLVQKYVPDIFSGDEQVPRQPEYIPVQGGEILKDEQLVSLLNETAASDRPVDPDPTILRSVLYSVMRYNGVDEEQAKAVTHRMFIGDIPGGHDGIAGMDRNGLYVVLNSSNFDELEKSGRFKTPNSWSSLVHLIAHEGTHVSSVPEHEEVSEDYGVLGTALLSGEVYAFSSTKEEFEGSFDFINPRVGEFYLPNTMEEWAAEAGRINFVRYLGKKGLSKDYTDSVEASHIMCRCHDFLQPSIREAYAPGGAQELGPVFSPDWLLGMHYKGQRAETFLQIGRGILGRNSMPGVQAASPDLVRGVGMLGFSAFAYERSFQAPGTLNALGSSKVDESSIKDLAQGHQDYLDSLYAA